MTLKKTTTRFRQFTLLFTLIILILVFSFLSPYFFTKSNLFNVMRQVSTTAICAVGMTMIIVLGSIDLSVGSMLALLTVLSAMIYTGLSNSLSGGALSIFTIVLVILIGSGIGLASGLITARGKIPAFVTTLALTTILRGTGFIITNGSPIPISDEAYKFFGSGWVLNIIPVPVVIMALIILAGAFFSRNTRMGRYIYAIGGNEVASRWSGVNTDVVKVTIFTIAGGLYGIGAMILAGRLGGGFPATAIGAEMDVIAGTILGGTSLSGGKGTIFGTLIGVLIIGVINNGLTLLDVSTYWQQIIMGAIILTAVLLDTRTKTK
jgi:ribose transport system permease protein